MTTITKTMVINTITKPRQALAQRWKQFQKAMKTINKTITQLTKPGKKVDKP